MKHKERVERVKNFTEKNKVFVIMVVIAVILLFSGFFFSKENKTITTEETFQSETAETENSLEWEFYPIDAWILLIGGGFCIIMILKEKRKSKEDLR